MIITITNFRTNTVYYMYVYTYVQYVRMYVITEPEGEATNHDAQVAERLYIRMYYI